MLVCLVGCHNFQVSGAVWNVGTVCMDPLCSPASLTFVLCDPLDGVVKLACILFAIQQANGPGASWRRRRFM